MEAANPTYSSLPARRPAPPPSPRSLSEAGAQTHARIAAKGLETESAWVGRLRHATAQERLTKPSPAASVPASPRGLRGVASQAFTQRMAAVPDGVPVEGQRQLQENVLRERLQASRLTTQKHPPLSPLSFNPAAANANLGRIRAARKNPETTPEDAELLEEAEASPEQGIARQLAFRLSLRRQQQMDRMRALTGQSEEDKAKAELQKQVRKAAKAAIRRGVQYLFTSIANVLTVGTAGVAIVVTIFIYAFSLLDLNIQMIWGYYITKKKSLFFPPLEWAPLPIPLPDIVLHALVVFVDIALFLGLMAVGISMFIMLFGPMLAALLGPAAALTLFTNPAFLNIMSNVAANVIAF
ncbi:hypothetical protein HY734_03570 [Candidatus Uhrbacteria bacterium]|nr:hypothetical protein [Candidatus Uhrbacteria bacterium]